MKNKVFNKTLTDKKFPERKRRDSNYFILTCIWYEDFDHKI